MAQIQVFSFLVHECTEMAGQLFVCCRCWKAIGFILLHSKGFLGSPYIAAVVIAEEYRERGIGTGMLHFAETVFAQNATYTCAYRHSMPEHLRFISGMDS